MHPPGSSHARLQKGAAIACPASPNCREQGAWNQMHLPCSSPARLQKGRATTACSASPNAGRRDPEAKCTHLAAPLQGCKKGEPRQYAESPSEGAGNLESNALTWHLPCRAAKRGSHDCMSCIPPNAGSREFGAKCIHPCTLSSNPGRPAPSCISPLPCTSLQWQAASSPELQQQAGGHVPPRGQMLGSPQMSGLLRAARGNSQNLSVPIPDSVTRTHFKRDLKKKQKNKTGTQSREPRSLTSARPGNPGHGDHVTLMSGPAAGRPRHCLRHLRDQSPKILATSQSAPP